MGCVEGAAARALRRPIPSARRGGRRNIVRSVSEIGVDDWERDLQEMAIRWDRFVLEAQLAAVAQWRSDFRALLEQERLLRAAGEWMGGLSDWLGILGRERHELTHSRPLGWLCDPSGQHGFGTAFLESFLRLIESPFSADPSAVISLEITGPSGFTRADVVIDLQDGRVVIENKIDHSESPQQCLRLSEDHPPPCHLVLLSPHLVAPLTAGSSLSRWKAVQWRLVSRALTECLGSATGPGRHVAVEYAGTLRRLFG
jgi:PD-(D/E)XK nuclease superfamily